MSDISIFCRRAFLNINPTQAFADRTSPVPKNRGHLQRVSSMIRGDQIAERLGAKLNPKEGYENDVCIYVKPRYDAVGFKFEGKTYIDIVDDIKTAVKFQDIPIISLSQVGHEVLTQIHPKDVFLIPQHHCNFERAKRYREGVTTVGIIGTIPAFNYLPEGLEERLAEKGVNLVKFSRFFSRQDIIDFYQRIDVQIVWRPYKIPIGNPLKIVNASAFGVPTIALWERWFKEVEGCYLPVYDVNGFITELEKLKDPSFYNECSQKCLLKAEEYHIDNICKLYRELK